MAESLLPHTAMHVAARTGSKKHPRSATREIREFMTEMPHSVGADQPLAVAHEMMQKHKIRHLPVLRAGRLVGLLSQRDLYLVETLRDVDPARVSVEEAMAQDAFCVAPTAPLASVATTMSERRLGCAVVMEGGEAVGIFTAVDALRALAAVLDLKGQPR